MGPSVSDLPKILLIVEGERREADFFHALAEQCGIPAAFYAVGGKHLHALRDDGEGRVHV